MRPPVPPGPISISIRRPNPRAVVDRHPRAPAPVSPSPTHDDVSATPAPTVVQPDSRSQRRSKSDARICHDPRRRSHVNHLRIVNGNVNVLRVGRHNLNAIIVGDHGLLLRVHERPRAGGLSSKPLDRGRDIRLLRGEGVADFRRPVRIPRQHLKNAWVPRNRLHRRVPRLVVNLIGIVARGNPRRRRRDVIRLRCRRENLRQQRIGIQRYGRQQIVELVRRHRRLADHLGRRRHWRSGVIAVSEGGQAREHRRENHGGQHHPHDVPDFPHDISHRRPEPPQ
jgi:hypothetical protein